MIKKTVISMLMMVTVFRGMNMVLAYEGEFSRLKLSRSFISSDGEFGDEGYGGDPYGGGGLEGGYGDPYGAGGYGDSYGGGDYGSHDGGATAAPPKELKSMAEILDFISDTEVDSTVLGYFDLETNKEDKAIFDEVPLRLLVFLLLTLIPLCLL
jgi:hypothetical protein